MINPTSACSCGCTQTAHSHSSTAASTASCCGGTHAHTHDSPNSHDDQAGHDTCGGHGDPGESDDPDHHDGHGGSCCGHTHAPAQAVDPATVGAASATRAVYRILNMDCPMEEALIRKKLGGMPGITGLEFHLMQRVLTVNHTLPSTEGIEAALRSIDMTPEALGQNEQADTAAPLPATRIPWVRLGLAAVFAALSEAAHFMQEGAREAGTLASPSLDAGITIMGMPVLQAAPLFFALLAIALGGLVTYRKGWIALRNGNLNINALMSVAVTGAVCIGQYPEAAMVMVLFNLSEAIEAKALDKARNAIKDLLALAPEKATVLRPASGDIPDAWVEMDVRDVPRGSRIRVRPGEKVALDGVILSGQSAINQAPITGESLPVEKGVGDSVYAGTINESGSFEFESTAAATDSTLARIIHAVEEAQGSRAPIQRFVDQFARYYTPAVFLVALLAALLPPLLLGSAWGASVYTALVILVIGCPCALVISTPVTLVSGMAAATRHGILIKGGMYLEQGRKIDCLALDKTGTLTHGKPSQTDFAVTGSMDANRVRSLAAGLASRSDHPVSRAIAASATADGVIASDVEDFAAVGGQGVSGTVEGTRWSLGNRRMMESLGLLTPALAQRITELEMQGKTVVLLAGQPERAEQAEHAAIQGLFAVADTLKDSSMEALRQLKKLGVKTVMLTGDNEHTARAVARQVGVDGCEANLLPQDKLRVVEELAAQGHTVGMVGDGINDAPALAKAQVGFAMAGNGTDTAIETADVALMDDDLRKIPRFIGLSRATYAILVQNISLALGVKALFFALTFTGHATMWMAVFADVGAALMVVGNGLRAMRQ